MLDKIATADSLNMKNTNREHSCHCLKHQEPGASPKISRITYFGL